VLLWCALEDAGIFVVCSGVCRQLRCHIPSNGSSSQSDSHGVSWKYKPNNYNPNSKVRFFCSLHSQATLTEHPNVHMLPISTQSGGLQYTAHPQTLLPQSFYSCHPYHPQHAMPQGHMHTTHTGPPSDIETCCRPFWWCACPSSPPSLLGPFQCMVMLTEGMKSLKKHVNTEKQCHDLISLFYYFPLFSILISSF